MSGKHASPIVITLSLTLAWARIFAQSPIQYMYDEVGRLIAVVDPSGDTAVYHYDAVGNVLAIDRHASTTVSVITLYPDSGPTGTTVTISGTGFSATASSDAVTFNGTAASITSATTTSLVVTVPTGATTGTIGVTAPGGSASSSQTFTVDSNGAPTISSFTPTIGVFGTSVTVSGANFNPTAANNRVLFNGLGSAAASTATSTSLSTAVGLVGGSGHLSVVTPAGVAVSTDDFFVPPSPYVATDVASTGRATLGIAANVPVATANKIGLLVFDATAGHRVSAKVVPGPGSSVTMYKPNGAVLATIAVSTLGGLIDPQTITTTGTYSMSVDPTGTATGTTTITLYDVPADLSGTINPGGSAVSSNLATPGQNAVYTLGSPTHPRVSLGIGGTSVTGIVSVRNADGSTLASTGTSVLTLLIEPWTFANGQSIKVDPAGAATGTIVLTAYDVPDDLTGTITPGGASVTPSIGTPGQNASYTLGTPTNTRVSLKIGGTGMSGVVSVKNADGSTLKSSLTSGLTLLLEPWTFASGQTIKVDPSGTATGTVTITAYDVPPDVTGAATIGGSAAPASITTPGQNGSLTFTGNASQQVTVHVTSNTIGAVTVKLLSTNGTTVLAQSLSGASSFNLSSATLPSSGTYTISIDPSSANTGTLNVSVTSP